MRKLVLAALLLLATSLPAYAQTGACPTSTALVVNPSGWVCITPATDYMTNTQDSTGATVPVVVRLDLLLFGPTKTNTATDAPDQTINIGKPTRNTSNAVWVQRSEISSLPMGQTYKARVVAVGQPATAGGAAQVSGRSPESNPFLRPFPSPPAPLAPLAISVPES